MTTILLADDDPGARELLRDLLQERGHAVLEAEDGASAREVARSRPIDGFVTDLWMPGMDGVEAVAAVRAEQPVPAVLVSALASDRDLARAAEVGVFAALEKPRAGRALAQVIARALGRPAALVVGRESTARASVARALACGGRVRESDRVAGAALEDVDLVAFVGVPPEPVSRDVVRGRQPVEIAVQALRTRGAAPVPSIQ